VTTDLPTERLVFPEGFLWGTATAAHQSEGGNSNNDWWAWEHNPDSPCFEPSGDAIDHYHRYESDIALLASFGHSAYRFSVEWARIEPEPGEFSMATLDHYMRVLETVHAHGMTPFVTLHHFSSPQWLAAEGGWASEGVVDRFRTYADHVARRLGHLIPFLCTINEPQIVALMGYQGTEFPPGAGDRTLFWPVTRNFVAAHQAALEVTKEHNSDTQVGLPLSITDFQAVDEEAQELRDRVHHRMVQTYLDALQSGVVRGPNIEEKIPGLGGSSDFVGVQYYSRAVLSKDGALAPPPGAETTQMGYEVVPQSFVNVLLGASASGLPIYVTENGIGTNDDLQRVRFIARHLDSVRTAIDRGADIRGYLYWCSIDNFEWTFGFERTFGLIACDRETFQRVPKPSASYYGEICRQNAVDPAITARFLESGSNQG
jgi:beta-glucosidase